MAKVNLSTMDIQSLMDLRKRIDERLRESRADIEKQLARLDRSIGETNGQRRGRVSSLRGRKVPPKYRGQSGETWAGRGARPRWLVAAIKEGKKLDDFLIDKSSQRGRKKKRRSKR
jgi:DNA-binding protein H-NS